MYNTINAAAWVLLFLLLVHMSLPPKYLPPQKSVSSSLLLHLFISIPISKEMSLHTLPATYSTDMPFKLTVCMMTLVVFIGNL